MTAVIFCKSFDKHDANTHLLYIGISVQLNCTILISHLLQILPVASLACLLYISLVGIYSSDILFSLHFIYFCCSPFRQFFLHLSCPHYLNFIDCLFCNPLKGLRKIRFNTWYNSFFRLTKCS